MSALTIGYIGVTALLVLLMAGVPIAWAMGAVGVLGNMAWCSGSLNKSIK